MDTYLKQAKLPDDKPIPSADDDVQQEPEVPQDGPAVATAVERRTLLLSSVALRVVTAVLSLLAFSIMASARTSAWDSGRYETYRLVNTFTVRRTFPFFFPFPFPLCHFLLG